MWLVVGLLIVLILVIWQFLNFVVAGFIMLLLMAWDGLVNSIYKSALGENPSDKHRRNMAVIFGTIELTPIIMLLYYLWPVVGVYAGVGLACLMVLMWLAW